MKKFIIFFILLAIVFGVGVPVFKKYVGDISPVLFPALKNKPKQVVTVKMGEPLDFDLQVAQGFSIGYFAKDLGPVRDLEITPGGRILASVPSQGKIIVLEDVNHDGIADNTQTLVTNLDRPHGIAIHGNFLFVAEETRVSRYLWTEKIAAGASTIIARLEKKLFDLPKGDRHFTRTIAIDKKGTMYVSIGSSCDACVEKHPFLASVIVSDVNGKKPEVFASGLRNAPFIALHPASGELWGTEMGRDFLGDTTPPDEINIIKQGSDYGWPYCYGQKVPDKNFTDTTADCANTQPPIYEIPAHSAPLGIAIIDSMQFPADWQNDVLVAYHGSWNSSVPVGYKVVRLKTKNYQTVEGEEDVVTGFLQNGSAVARPVDVVFDTDGNLYISDDKGGNIFIVSKK